ncbi:cobalamin-binding protein [Thalassotalea sp. G2M2-11]|uniref:cobalamin-binding protein n=1 Tax=Thalassotalea sp. G2M2-11 TaxID=2787627 RepID=UPI0019CF5093|nr:cobalamin-binding protein [Thalassotalea sp. G2M2-11]
MYAHWKKLLFICLTCLLQVHQVYAEQPSEPAKRIIALAPHIVELLFEVGAGEQIVGTTQHADYPREALDIPRVGNYARLNIEQVLASDPDLIIAWKSGNPSDDIARLKQLGLNIVYSQPNTLEEVASELKYFARLTGHKEQGEQKAAQFLSRLRQLQAQYQDKQPISGFLELWSRPLTTVAKDSWIQQQLDVCRVNNPFVDSATDYPQINVEQVVLAAPEVIIQPSSHGMKAPETIDWQQWPMIPAVKSGAFIHPNADKLHRMTSRALDELTLLCQHIEHYRTKKLN